MISDQAYIMCVSLLKCYSENFIWLWGEWLQKTTFPNTSVVRVDSLTGFTNQKILITDIIILYSMARYINTSYCPCKFVKYNKLLNE